MRKPHPVARALRRDMPEAERRLWARLHNRGLGDLRFRRQHTIGSYVADFACLEAKLVVEIDGDQHGRNDAPLRDKRRDAAIGEYGFIVLRFWNHEVRRNLDGVLQTILLTALDRLRQAARGEKAPSVGFADTSPASGGGDEGGQDG